MLPCYAQLSKLSLQNDEKRKLDRKSIVLASFLRHRYFSGHLGGAEGFRV